jgi:hypothetical protein
MNTMNENQEPTVIYCVTGLQHIIYLKWSIRSLLMFNYKNIEVIVSTEEEKQYIKIEFPEITCEVINVDTKGYPIIGYKSFALQNYLKLERVKNSSNREIVICDADVLWNKDPQGLFKRFKGQLWVQKIIALNPEEFKISTEKTLKSNVGMLTLKYYDEMFGISIYPTYQLNAGLFMLPQVTYERVLDSWMKKILSMPKEKMLLSEALMSLTYAEMKLIPISDKGDIKHLGREKEKTSFQIGKFHIADKKNSNEYSGYQAATHYLSDQKKLLHATAKKRGLVQGNELEIVEKIERKKIPKRILRKIKKMCSL